jgi:hypothetical protein
MNMPVQPHLRPPESVLKDLENRAYSSHTQQTYQFESVRVDADVICGAVHFAVGGRACSRDDAVKAIAEARHLWARKYGC